VAGWSKQVTPDTGVTFVCIADEDIQMLVPPGSGTEDWDIDRSRHEDGLWLWACWEDQAGHVLIEFDAPTYHCQRRTSWALEELGQAWRDEVIDLMHSQLEQFWALSGARETTGLEEARTQVHAGILMALTVECQEAFSNETFWRVRMPEQTVMQGEVVTFRDAVTGPAYVGHAHRGEDVLPTRGLLFFALRMLVWRMVRRRPVRVEQLDEQLGAWIPTSRAVHVAPDPGAELRGTGRVAEVN